jgi:hypothetical protein
VGEQRTWNKSPVFSLLLSALSAGNRGLLVTGQLEAAHFFLKLSIHGESRVS